jgi:hypothetical protein
MRCAWALLVQPADLNIPILKTSNVANIRLHGGYSRPCDALRTHFAVPVTYCWAMESSSKHLAENKGQKVKVKAKQNKHTCSRELIYV